MSLSAVWGPDTVHGTEEGRDRKAAVFGTDGPVMTSCLE